MMQASEISQERKRDKQREIEIERDGVWESACERERVCVCEREREIVWERNCVSESVWEYVWEKERVFVCKMREIKKGGGRWHFNFYLYIYEKINEAIHIPRNIPQFLHQINQIAVT